MALYRSAPHIGTSLSGTSLSATGHTPAILPPAALHELKDYLRITLADEDATLISALRSSMDICANFIGSELLSAPFREDININGQWQHLSKSPVMVIDDVMGLMPDGSEFALPIDHYAIDILYGGKGRVRVVRPGEAARVRISYHAGLAQDWSSLAEALRSGIIRMAAHIYTSRNADGGPPLAIAALWQPYRQMRLS